MDNFIDATRLEDENISIQDGIGEIAKILGGIALVAAENKRMLESKNPDVAEGALKSVGVLGASLVGIGGSIAKFAARNLNK